MHLDQSRTQSWQDRVLLQNIMLIPFSQKLFILLQHKFYNLYRQLSNLKASIPQQSLACFQKVVEVKDIILCHGEFSVSEELFEVFQRGFEERLSGLILGMLEA